MLTEAEIIALTNKLTEGLETIPEAGRIIPGPVFYGDAADYWRGVNHVSRPTTQVEIETGHIEAFWILFRGFQDQGGTPHSPLFDVIFEFYGFSQYDLQRQDANVTAEEIARRILRYHVRFTLAIAKIKEYYQGERALGLFDPERYARQFTQPVVQEEFVTDRGPCEYIRNVEGHTIRLFESVRLQLKEC
jgi:hypothetical protein